MKTTLTYAWQCQSCPAKGEGPTSNRQAERHGDAEMHSTITSATPQGDK